MAVSQKPQEFLEAFAAAWSSAMQSLSSSSTDCDDDSSYSSDESDFSIISDTGSAEVTDNEEDFITVSPVQPLVSPSVQTNEPTSLSKFVCAEVEEKINSALKLTAFHEELRQRTPRTMQPLAISDLLLRPEVDATTCESPFYCTRAGPIPIARSQESMTCSAGADSSVHSYTLARPSHPENVTTYTGDGFTAPSSRTECSPGVKETDKLQHCSSRHSDHPSNEAHAADALAEISENAGCTLNNAVPSFNAGPPGFLPAVTDINPSAVTQRNAMISDLTEYIRDDLKSLPNTSLCGFNVHDSDRAIHDKTVTDYEARLLAKDAEILQLASKNREHVDKMQKMDAFLIEKEGDHIWQLDRIIERMGETDTVAKLEIAKLTEQLRKAEVEHDQLTKRLEKAEPSVNELSVNELTGPLNEKMSSPAAVTNLVRLKDKNLVEMNIQLKSAETKLSEMELADHPEKIQMRIKHASDLARLRKRSEKTEKELKKALTNAENELEQKTAQLATAELVYKAKLAVDREDFEDRIMESHAAFDQVRDELKSKISELNGAKLNHEDLERINKDLSHKLETFYQYWRCDGATGSGHVPQYCNDKVLN